MAVLSLLPVCSHPLTFWGLWENNLVLLLVFLMGFGLAIHLLYQFMCVDLPRFKNHVLTSQNSLRVSFISYFLNQF